MRVENALAQLALLYLNAYTTSVSPIRLRLRELRRARGWSQADLGRKAGVRQATISRLESGTATKLSLEVLEKLAAALEVDPGYLLVRVPAGDERRS